MANIFARAVDSLIKLYLLLHLFLGIALDSQSGAQLHVRPNPICINVELPCVGFNQHVTKVTITAAHPHLLIAGKKY
jgi:hypothetical protein